jgi:hypothetical protein
MFRMVPKRPSGPYNPASAARTSGSIPFPGMQPFDAAKSRVLAKLEDRMDTSASKRMPSSLLRQTLRQQAELLTEQESRGLIKSDRERLVEEVLAELLGYGPLDELFKDAAVREVMVTGPQVVIVRRELETWAPTNIRFRDEEHFRTALDRLATHADSVGGVTTSVNLFDLKLPNGFRAVGVVPPTALGASAVVAFIRVEPAPNAAGTTQAAASTPALNITSPSADATNKPVSGSITVSPRPVSGSTAIAAPAPRTTLLAESDPLVKHRNKIIERFISTLSRMGVYDLQRVEVAELRRVVAAYVAEYIAAENIYLSDSDQGRLQLEILTAMHR